MRINPTGVAGRRTAVSLLAGAVVLATVLFGRVGAAQGVPDESGRYQIAATAKHVFILDTRTGVVKQVWCGDDENASQLKQLGKGFDAIQKSIYVK
jgi:hypothetical protein